MSTLLEPIGPTDHVLGRPNAPASLVEYGDYECSHCARAHYEVAEVLRRVGNDVRYAYRHFPLTRLHPHALLAAQAAEAAGAEGRFWPMHSMLFEIQRPLDLAELMDCADTVGIDLLHFSRDLRAGLHLPKIESDFRGGVRSGVDATPTFFLNSVRLEGRWDADTLSAAIREAIAQSGSAPVGWSRPPAQR